MIAQMISQFQSALSSPPMDQELSGSVQKRLKSYIEAIRPEDTYSDVEYDMIFDLATAPLIQQYKKIVSPRITVCVYVLSDGLGDWATALKVIKTIEKYFETPKISIAAIIDDFDGARKSIIEGSLPKNLEKDLLTGDPTPEQQAPLRALFEGSDLVVETNWLDPDLCDPDSDDEPGDEINRINGIFALPVPDGIPVLRFAESGARVGGNGYDVDHGGGAPGLDPRQLGIFFSDDSNGVQPLEIRPESLKQFLSENENLPNYEFFFGYIKDNSFSFAFINLCCLSTSDQVNVVDIIASVEYENIPEFFVPLLSKAGVRKISFHKLNAEGNVENCNEQELENAIGKTVRVINPFPIPQQSFDALVRKSRRLNGCTKVDSFEASLHSVAFYEILEHKKPFFESLLQLLRENFSAHSPLRQYYQLLPGLDTAVGLKQNQEVGTILESLSNLLKTQEINVEASKLLEIIKSEHNLGEMIRDLITLKIAQFRDKTLSELLELCRESCLLEGSANKLIEYLKKTHAEQDVPIVVQVIEAPPPPPPSQPNSSNMVLESA